MKRYCPHCGKERKVTFVSRRRPKLLENVGKKVIKAGAKQLVKKLFQ